MCTRFAKWAAAFLGCLVVLVTSLQTAFAEPIINNSGVHTVEGFCSMFLYEESTDPYMNGANFPAPIRGALLIDRSYQKVVGSPSDSTRLKPFMFMNSSLYDARNDFTVYWQMSPVLWNGKQTFHKPFYRKTDVGLPTMSAFTEGSPVVCPVTAVFDSTNNPQATSAVCYRSTIPAGKRYFRCKYAADYQPRYEGDVSIYISNFNIVNSADRKLLDELDLIYKKVAAIEGDTSKISAAITQIVNEQIDQGKTLDLCYQTLDYIMKDLDDIDAFCWRVLRPGMQDIAAIKEAILNGMQSQTDAFDKENAQHQSDLDQGFKGEDQLIGNMNTGFDNLHLEGFTFGSLVNAFKLISSSFTTFWQGLHASGASILVTFPLLLGIVGLLIGRVSRYMTRYKTSSGGKGGKK